MENSFIPLMWFSKQLIINRETEHFSVNSEIRMMTTITIAI